MNYEILKICKNKSHNKINVKNAQISMKVKAHQFTKAYKKLITV